MKRVLGAVLAVLATPAIAQAYVPPGATIASASLELREQGDDASGAPDLSADGRFVVFETRARNLFGPDFTDPPGAHYEGGVMIRDLVSGRLELVAPGDLVGDDGTIRTRGARSPSVSADGRFVAFSTAQQLVPADSNGNIDVYVLDRATYAYELISARDGSDIPASYGVRDPDIPGRNPGADVSPAVSISADGDRVLFRTVDVASDLPAAGSPLTPPYQLLVRVRSTKRTLLVTRDMTTGEPAAGAPVGGALSADGTTVAWPGTAADVQTRFLDGEAPDPSSFYYLWRRIEDGPGAPTRRITGAAEPEVPGCTVYDSRPGVVNACTGPLSDREQYLGTAISTTLPALSADGRRVAFITGAPPRPSVLGVTQDLWVTDMHDGVPRTAGSTELTREGANKDPLDASAVSAVTLSPDGRWAAIVTQRTRFLLPALRLVDTPTTAIGIDELYLVDLATGAVERAARGWTGANADGSVGPALSLSDGGRRVAFASSADNLFFGDANQRTDVFVVDRADAPPPAPVEQEPPAEAPAEAFDPPAPAVAKLRVTLRKAPKGRVRLRVRAPGRGSFAVAVRGRIPDRDGRLRGPARLLGSARKTVKKAGVVTLEVKLAKKYAPVARREKKLDGSATITFTPKSGAKVTGTTTVRFAAPPKSR